MAISVIIPAYRPHSIKECISAIVNSEHKPMEIILVDDNSGINYFKNIEQDCKIIKLDKRSGPAKARNIGVENSNGDLLCFIDSDVLIFKDTLRLIMSVFEKNPGISAVQTICADKCIYRNLASQYQNLYFRFNTMAIKGEYLATIIGNCFTVRREDFILIGGFDEKIRRATVEDGNFGFNLYCHKKKIYLAKGIEVEHRSYLSAAIVLKKMFMKSSDKVYTLLMDKKLFKIDLDKTEHSKMKIAAILASFFLMVSSISIIFFSKFFYVSLLSLLIFLICSWQFIYFCHQKNGLIFATKVGIFHYVNCLSGAFGLSCGLVRFFKLKCIK